MSGSRPNPVEGHLAEQHLGDRLSALVDGELGHDTRERVLAHVATCPKCKAEVDAQRRLKDVFAAVAPPAPSESFLARLQGLPGGGDPEDGGGTPLGGGGLAAFRMRRPEPFALSYDPTRGPATALATGPAVRNPALAPGADDRGFRIHPVGRGDAERSRGLRFAFAAAGAVSLAAIALGGMTGSVPVDPTADARGGSGNGSNVTPARTSGTGSATTPETSRRRGSAPLFTQSGRQGGLGDHPAAPTEVSAPLLPGLPTPAAGRQGMTPVVAGAAARSPLIRPLDVPPISLTSLTTAPEFSPPGLLALGTGAPEPTPSSAVTPGHSGQRER
ncbi:MULTISPECIES: anti-sigma factor family protein [unclassified Streptomyces]|uniref:anti-sigma factor family protein n=1 Tax=unclassified Streptomyces TaxID=2593676 RepID=UPI003D75632A